MNVLKRFSIITFYSQISWYYNIVNSALFILSNCELSFDQSLDFMNTFFHTQLFILSFVIAIMESQLTDGFSSMNVNDESRCLVSAQELVLSYTNRHNKPLIMIDFYVFYVSLAST